MATDSGTSVRPLWLAPFGWFAVIFLLAANAVGLRLSPPDSGMGHLQKIMYVHVPAAWSAFAAFAVVFVASLLYLGTRQERHDLLAAAAAEVGAVLTALTLVLGVIWGRPTWGIWWTWDPRLTSTAILLLIYVGYLALRAFTEDDEKRARWSAAVGILGAINVPIVYMSVQWWRTLHQLQSTQATLDIEYVLGLGLNAVAFLFLLIYFVAARYHVAQLESAAEARLAERGLVEAARG